VKLEALAGMGLARSIVGEKNPLKPNQRQHLGYTRRGIRHTEAVSRRAGAGVEREQRGYASRVDAPHPAQIERHALPAH